MPGESLNISCITNVATAKQWLYPDSSNIVITMIDSLVQQLQISDFYVADNVGEYSCIATINGMSISKNITIAGQLLLHVIICASMLPYPIKLFFTQNFY